MSRAREMSEATKNARSKQNERSKQNVREGMVSLALSSILPLEKNPDLITLIHLRYLVQISALSAPFTLSSEEKQTNSV